MWRLPHEQQPVLKHWPRQRSGVTRADGERQTGALTEQQHRPALLRHRDLDAPGANSCTRYTCLPSSKAPYSAMMWSCTSPEWICISRATCSPAYGPDHASRTGMCRHLGRRGAAVTSAVLCWGGPATVGASAKPVADSKGSSMPARQRPLGRPRTWYQFRVDSLCLRYSFSATGWLLWRQVARYSRLALPRYSCLTRS